jgi:ADP-heptose:LPS heptosyltransferase
MPTGKQKVLIFRPGSLGDTVIALPCFHLIARVFPASERRILTHSPVHGNYVSLESVLGCSGLVHGYFEVGYRAVRRSLKQQIRLARRLREWKPDIAIYLTLPRNPARAVTEWAFFKFSGIRRIIGVPFRQALRTYAFDPATGLYESEASRLARCIADLGDAAPADPKSWDLRLSKEEREFAGRQLGVIGNDGGFVSMSVGAGMDANDWSESNWATLVAKMGVRYAELPLVMVGGAADFAPSERVSRHWPGVKLNLCGKINPRETAAVLERAAVYVGHDSGPIHLAAAVGTPCVGIYAAREKPGVWFPFGRQHKIIYHQTECSGCGLKTCVVNEKKCIHRITSSEVLGALREVKWRSQA